jgi:hypothetical protein
VGQRVVTVRLAIFYDPVHLEPVHLLFGVQRLSWFRILGQQEPGVLTDQQFHRSPLGFSGLAFVSGPS